jgi:hypothetical protein
LYSIEFTAATPEKVSREYSITPHTITSAKIAQNYRLAKLLQLATSNAAAPKRKRARA